LIFFFGIELENFSFLHRRITNWHLFNMICNELGGGRLAVVSANENHVKLLARLITNTEKMAFQSPGNVSNFLKEETYVLFIQ
jgi:hypothetical protein